jgi:hypothetical protein
MIPEPQILETQFAILMADGATGHVLNVNGEVHQSDNSDAYVILDNLDEARKHVVQVQKNNNTIECMIYNSKNELVEFHKAPKWF